jgi:hypothetical protein
VLVYTLVALAVLVFFRAREKEQCVSANPGMCRLGWMCRVVCHMRPPSLQCVGSVAILLVDPTAGP